MSVSKTILDEPFSLGGELGSDDPGARTDYAGGGSQVAQVQSREFAKRLLLARRTNAKGDAMVASRLCRTPTFTCRALRSRQPSTRTQTSFHRHSCA